MDIDLAMRFTYAGHSVVWGLNVQSVSSCSARSRSISIRRCSFFRFEAFIHSMKLAPSELVELSTDLPVFLLKLDICGWKVILDSSSCSDCSFSILRLVSLRRKSPWDISKLLRGRTFAAFLLASLGWKVHSLSLWRSSFSCSAEARFCTSICIRVTKSTFKVCSLLGWGFVSCGLNLGVWERCACWMLSSRLCRFDCWRNRNVSNFLPRFTADASPAASARLALATTLGVCFPCSDPMKDAMSITGRSPMLLSNRVSDPSSTAPLPAASTAAGFVSRCTTSVLTYSFAELILALILLILGVNVQLRRSENSESGRCRGISSLDCTSWCTGVFTVSNLGRNVQSRASCSSSFCFVSLMSWLRCCCESSLLWMNRFTTSTSAASPRISFIALLLLWLILGRNVHSDCSPCSTNLDLDSRFKSLSRCHFVTRVWKGVFSSFMAP
mmetsp:Transcript_28688/g.63684  ORF Transcript_28688/g.63684 Transcript_28688/m.63684 type:complete len:442 (+) Transcript_28688:255-1580(+)